MRILACSDLDGDIDPLLRIRGKERNEFDLILVAGDIGHIKSPQVLEIFDSFECPVLYVFGNHDYEAPYVNQMGTNGVHLHDNPYTTEKLAVVGFSGCESNWGNNPHYGRLIADFTSRKNTIYKESLERLEAINSGLIKYPNRERNKLEKSIVYLQYKADLNLTYKKIIELNRLDLVQQLQSCNSSEKFTIVMTHEKLTKPKLDLPSVDCFIFGHRHKFSYTHVGGVRSMNVAALCNSVTIEGNDKAHQIPRGFGRASVGNYCKFHILNNELKNLTLTTFGWDQDNFHAFRFQFRDTGGSFYASDPSRDVTETIVC